MHARARRAQQEPLLSLDTKEKITKIPKEVRRPDLAREGGVSPQAPQPAGASPRAREPASLGARAAAALGPRPGAAHGGQERARGSAGPRSRSAAGSAGGRGRARSGAGSALGPQRGAGEKEAGTAPSLKTKASFPGGPPPENGQKIKAALPAGPPSLQTPDSRPVPNSPAEAAEAADLPRPCSPSPDSESSMDSCSCALPACGHVGEGRKCLSRPAQPPQPLSRPASGLSRLMWLEDADGWGCRRGGDEGTSWDPRRMTLKSLSLSARTGERQLMCATIFLLDGAFLGVEGSEAGLDQREGSRTEAPSLTRATWEAILDQDPLLVSTGEEDSYGYTLLY